MMRQNLHPKAYGLYTRAFLYRFQTSQLFDLLRVGRRMSAFSLRGLVLVVCLPQFFGLG
jgi:hypothetical protein